MNADATGVKNWINDSALLSNRLVINGRLYSFNTRGGSLTAALDDTPANPGKYFTDSTLMTDSTSTVAASMDLEKFRVAMNSADISCSLFVQYRLFTSSTLPALLRRPINYTSGTCSF